MCTKSFVWCCLISFSASYSQAVPRQFQQISRPADVSARMAQKLGPDFVDSIGELASPKNISLSFDSAGLTDSELRHLVKRGVIHSRIRFLDLQKNDSLRNPAFRQVIDTAPNLQNFSFIYTAATADLVHYAVEHLHKVRRLEVNEVDPDALEALASHQGLTYLNISNARLSADDIESFLIHPAPSLRELVISAPEPFTEFARLKKAASSSGIKLSLRLRIDHAAFDGDGSKIHDGDTFKIDLPELGGVGEMLKGIRLYSVDTAELQRFRKGRLVDPFEEVMAWAARNFVLYHLKTAKRIRVRDGQAGKYFRLLADVLVSRSLRGSNFRSLSPLLTANGFAIQYFGKTKTILSWAQIYLSNRAFYDYWFEYDDYGRYYHRSDIEDHPFYQQVSKEQLPATRQQTVESFYQEQKPGLLAA